MRIEITILQFECLTIQIERLKIPFAQKCQIGKINDTQCIGRIDTTRMCEQRFCTIELIIGKGSTRLLEITPGTYPGCITGTENQRTNQ